MEVLWPQKKSLKFRWRKARQAWDIDPLKKELLPDSCGVGPVFTSCFFLLMRSPLGKAFDNFSGLEERLALAFVQLCDVLRQPCAFFVPHGVADGKALCSKDDIQLAAVGWMRLAFHHAHFLQRSDGGPHGLGLHTLGAGEFGSCSRAVAVQARHDRGFGQREFV